MMADEQQTPGDGDLASDFAAAALYAALQDRWSEALFAVDILYSLTGGQGIAALLCSLSDAVAAVLPSRDPGYLAAGHEWATRFLTAYLADGRAALTLTSEIPAGHARTYTGAVLTIAAATINQQVGAGWRPPDGGQS